MNAMPIEAYITTAVFLKRQTLSRGRIEEFKGVAALSAVWVKAELTADAK
jgi:hypothetical protein